MNHRIIQVDCRAWLEDQPYVAGDELLFDLTFGSPPYPHKGKRYPGGSADALPAEKWVDFMETVTGAALRLTRGYVIWVVNNPVIGGAYIPAIEMLQCRMLELSRERGNFTLERPDIWHKNAPPSRCRANNQQDWFSNDYEQVLVYKKPGAEKIFSANWQQLAAPPKYTNGGHFRQRSQSGQRTRGSDYPTGKLARPRDVFRCLVGGGHMGYDAEDDKLACQGEAPFPLGVAERFLRACCPAGGTVLDPFAGSGTTGVMAEMLGMNSVLIDIRESQCELARTRIERVKQQMQGAN